MEDLIVHGSTSSPYVEFRTNGKFIIQGRILTDNAINLFDPFIAWVKKYEGPSVDFTIDLDYVNTSASLQLFLLLQLLDENKKIENIQVKWFYEPDDEDHLETGEFYKEKLSRTEFEYIIAKDRMIA